MTATNLGTPMLGEETYALEIRRLIRAPRERVFQAWTDPADLSRWHAPEGLRPETVEANAREGGSYQVRMRREMTRAGERYPELSIESGAYEIVVQNELLVFTSRGDWNPEEVTRVRVEFHDALEGTEIVIKQTLFRAEASRNGHGFGWNGALNKLEAILA